MAELIILVASADCLCAGGWIMGKIDSFIDRHVVNYNDSDEEANECEQPKQADPE